MQGCPLGARRTAVSQIVMAFRGLAPVALTGRYGDATPLAATRVLSGSLLLHRSPGVASAQRDPPSGLLGGAIPFTATHEVADQPSLLEPAPTLSPDDGRIDQPF